MFSKDNSNLAAICSGAKISTNATSEERLTFSRTSEELHDAIASAGRSRTIVKPERRAPKELRAKEIAKSGSKEAEIGAE